MLENGTVRRTILDNGIRVITERMPFVRSVALGIWVRAGSVNESLANNGIAHFLEHMLFKGTTTRSAKEIAQSLEALGGGINGSTGKETSIYSAHILDEHLEIAVDVLADLVQNPKFDKSDIELEKQVVIAEMAHAKEDPEEFAFDNFYKNMFPHHPLGYFIYGLEENILRFDKADLEEFKEAQYTTDRMVVAAAGNVEHDKLVDLVQKHFSGVLSATGPTMQKLPLKSVAPSTRIQSKGLQQAHILLGARTFGFGDNRRYALALLDVLFGGGMSSRLFQNIREKYGFTYSVFSFSDIMAETGVFGSYIACDKRKVNDSINLLEEELDKIKLGDITDQELAMTKSQVRGNLILGLESSGRRMKRIGEAEMYTGEHKPMDEIIAAINKVEKTELEALAKEIFTSTNTSITILSP